MSRVSWPAYPLASLTASRADLPPTPMEVLQGALPKDLRGHLFVIGPAGSVASGGLKTPPREPTSLLSGDAYVVRVDLRDGAATVRGRLLRTPDLVADELAHARGGLLRFAHAGLSRVSPVLGVRNTTNTALIPFRPRGERRTRLMVTWDAGRPAEIDPESLEWVTHVGEQDEWRAGALPRAPFPLVFGTAHPAWDPQTREAFLLNFGRSVADLLSATPLVPQPGGRGLTAGARIVTRLLRARRPGVAQHVNALRAALHRAGERLVARLPGGGRLLDGLMPERFTDLLRWDGRGTLRGWTLVDQDGRRVGIGESAHQVGVSGNWVVFMDTAFLVGPESILSQLSALPDALERGLRALIRRPLDGHAELYFVDRRELDATPAHEAGTLRRAVRARRVALPWGALHFSLDRAEDADGNVRIVVAHSHGVDLSAWVLQGETNGLDGEPVDDVMIGAHPSPVDQNRVVEWTIDPRTGAVVRRRICPPSDTTWGVALGASRHTGVEDCTPDETGDLYFYSSGLHPHTVTSWAWRQYVDDAEDRIVSEEDVRARAAAGGVPGSVWRLDRESMTVGDSWTAPPGGVLCSPQFVARRRGRKTVRDDRDGWLIVSLFVGEEHTWLVFDAARLAAGPVCTLRCPTLDVGFTMHTAWMPRVAAREAAYRIDPRADLEGRIPSVLEPFFADVYDALDPEGT